LRPWDGRGSLGKAAGNRQQGGNRNSEHGTRNTEPVAGPALPCVALAKQGAGGPPVWRDALRRVRPARNTEPVVGPATAS